MRLGKDEHHEGISRKRTLLVKDTATQILLQAQLPFLIRVEGEVMPLIHLVEVDSEFFCGELSGVTVPAIAKQHSSKIQKEGGDTCVSHVCFPPFSSCQTRSENYSCLLPLRFSRCSRFSCFSRLTRETGEAKETRETASNQHQSPCPEPYRLDHLQHRSRVNAQPDKCNKQGGQHKATRHKSSRDAHAGLKLTNAHYGNDAQVIEETDHTIYEQGDHKQPEHGTHARRNQIKLSDKSCCERHACKG